jgi:hypothetical protein
MSGFEFTNDEFERGSEKQAFNNGKAGKAKNVKVWMEEAGANGVPAKTKPNAPDFKVFFEDADGYKVNKACFSIKKEDYPDRFGNTYEQAIRKEWLYLNNIVKHTGGISVLSFTDDVDLFRKIAAAIGTGKVNVFVNYGSKRSPKMYLEPRKWLPAVEAANTSDAESKLKATGVDAMSAPVPDSEDEVSQDFFA